MRGRFQIQGCVELSALVAELSKHGFRDASTYLLATQRPVTARPCRFDLRAEYLLEFVGGVVEQDEDFIDGGIRELCEELGLQKNAVQAYAPLLPAPVAFDAGVHVEWTSLAVAICFGTPAPPMREGILPHLCEMVPLAGAHALLLERMKSGVGIDASAPVLLDRMFVELCGGWSRVLH
ncbi:MAG: NUDIX domain-containing protein [Bdellovibrionota bacterium]